MLRGMERIPEPQVMDDREEAAAYDAMDFSQVNTAFLDRLMELGGGGYCLDIGTGNGAIPLDLADRDTKLICVGIDLSQAMIDNAMRRRATSHNAGRVMFKIADACAMPFEDGEFNTVFSNTILHHIPDPRPFLSEAWRVLAAGGTLLIRDLFRPADEATLEALVREHAGDESPMGQQLLRQSLAAAFTPDELRDIVSGLGMTGVEVVIDTDRHVSIQTSSKP